MYALVLGNDLVIGSLLLVGVLLISIFSVLFIHRRGTATILKLQHEIGVLNRGILKEREELGKREDEIERINVQVTQLRQANRALEADLKTALDDSQQGKDGMELLRQKLAGMEAQLRLREQDAGANARRAGELEEALEALQAEIEGLRMSADQQVHQFENYSTSLLQMRQRLEEQLRNCQDALRRSQLELADARRTITELSGRGGGVPVK